MKKLVLFLSMVLLLFIAGPANQPAAAQGNLLTNPSFEGGYFNQDGIPEIAVPNGWRMHWLDGQPFAGATGVAHRPETVVWNIADAPAHELHFWREGSFILKIFKGGRPMYAALSQDVSGLQVGRHYRISAPVFVDIVADYDASGNKIAPHNPDSGRVRLGAGPVGAPWRDEGQINYSGWWSGSSIPNFYLNYNIYVHEFVATHTDMTIWIEVAALEDQPNNGFFMDAMVLQALDQTSSPPPAQSPPPSGDNPPPAAPAAPAAPANPIPGTPDEDGVIRYTVQSGDALWSIAARANLTLDELLNLNNMSRDDFIQPGQVLILGHVEVEEEEIVEEEMTEEGVAEEEAMAAEAEEIAPPEPEPTPEPPAGGTICLLAFDDANQNGQFDDGEALRDSVVFTISDDNAVVSNYVTDGVSEPFCIELDAGNYRITRSTQPNEVLTTPGDWGILLTDGTVEELRFGSYISEEEETAVAAVEPEAEAAAAESDAAALTQAAAAPDAEGDGWASAIVIAAVVLALLLLVGVLIVIFSARRSVTT